jgi:anti-sigma B factor antagonist
MDELVSADDMAARVELLGDTAGVPCLKLTGEVDLSNVATVRAAIDEAIARTTAGIIFDLADLGFIDSSGLAMLVGFAEQTESVELRHPRPMVLQVIELTGLSEIFRITP